MNPTSKENWSPLLHGVYVIAEAGVNHNGDLALAHRLIDEAVQAGANAVKFQTFQTEKLVTQSAPQAVYQSVNMGKSTTQFEMLKKLELSHEDHEKLKNYAVESGIDFLSTPFDFESADFLNALGVPFFKVPSGEITNRPFILHLARFLKPLIVSTGMSTLEEVKRVRTWLLEKSHDEQVYLHCTSSYPAEFSEVNLNAMKTMGEALGVAVGYSDHTLSLEVPFAAAVLGACVIEKHFTLDQNLPGPDHKASLVPSELKKMVDQIRKIPSFMGSSEKKPTEKERETLKVARKSLVLSRALQSGDQITEGDLEIKRPGTGIPPFELEKVVGKILKVSLEEDTPIQWEHLK